MKKNILFLALLGLVFTPGCVALEVFSLAVDTAELVEDIRTDSDAFTRAAQSWEGAQIGSLISAWGNPDRTWLDDDGPARKGWRNYYWDMSKNSDRNFDLNDEDGFSSLTVCQVTALARADGTVDKMKVSNECSDFTPWASRH